MRRLNRVRKDRFSSVLKEVHNQDARFAEPCRDAPLKLTAAENNVLTLNKGAPNRLVCEQEIYLGFFFDGTNNNKFRDVKGNSQSNVARLFDVFVGPPTIINAIGKALLHKSGMKPALASILNPHRLF